MLLVRCRRPVYQITCDHGEACSTGDECLTRLEEEPRDLLMPPSSLPSKISTSPSEDVSHLGLSSLLSVHGRRGTSPGGGPMTRACLSFEGTSA